MSETRTTWGEEFDTDEAGLFVVTVANTGKTVAIQVKPGEIVVLRIYRDGSYGITETSAP